MNAPRFFSLVSVALLAVFVGCGKPAAPASPPASGHPLPSPFVLPGEPGQRGGRLTLLATGAPRTFNPVLTMDGASDAVVRLLFSGLITLDATTQEARPALAESWSVSTDGLTWTFKLRAGLRWSDGQPLSAADVVFTWNEVMYNPDMNRITYELFRINGKNFEVTQVDEATVKVVTPEVFAPFLEVFGNVPILPKHIIGREVAERRFLSVLTPASRADRIVGSGPFRVKESKPGESVLLERNPEYWAVDAQGVRLPYLDEVLITATAGASATLFFLNGQGDVCEQGRPNEYTTVQAAAAAGKFRVMDLSVGTERDFLWFNLNTNRNGGGQPLVNPVKSAWFRNKTFRQAVSCAIDRDRIIQTAYGGRAAAPLAFLSDGNPKWNNPDVPRFGYDPARARSLLAGMGIQDRNGDGLLEDATGQGIEFTLISNTGNPAREKTAQLIVEDLSRLGIKVSFQPVDYATMLARINDTFDYECALMGLSGGGLDPASQMNVLMSSDPMHQWFPNQRTPATEWEARIDFLMNAQLRTLDFATRKKHFDEVQAILAEQQPMIYTVAPFHFAALRADLVNVRPSALTNYRLTWNLEQLALKSTVQSPEPSAR